MSAKRKISIRKVLQVLLGLAATGCCITGLLSAANIEDNRKLTGVEVNITNSDKYRFLNEGLVMDMAINNRHINVLNEPVKSLDIHQMEHILSADPWVANAQAYIDDQRVLHLTVTQRAPIVRIFENNGGSFYLDTSLSQMPLSTVYTYYTTIVTNVPQLHDDSTSRQIKGEIVSLVGFVEANPFWRAQIAQIAMDSTGNFVLTPVLGSHMILLGDTSDMKDKFNNLFQFYKKIMNHIGWDKYEKLDLRFKGQVVASPSLPWKGPVDKGMKTMSWYNSIMDSLRSKNDDGVVAAAPVTASAAVAAHKAPVTPQRVAAPPTPPPVKVVKTASAKPTHKAVKQQKILHGKPPAKTIKGKYIYKRSNTQQTH